jgi:hypothetical protein
LRRLFVVDHRGGQKGCPGGRWRDSEAAGHRLGRKWLAGGKRGGEKMYEEEVVDKGKKSSSGARKKARGRRTRGRALTLSRDGSHDRATHSDIL